MFSGLTAYLRRSESSECMQACFTAQQPGQGAPERRDALVRAHLGRFVAGSEAQVIDRGTRLMRHVIESGMRDSSTSLSTWFATLGRMEALSPRFAMARRIAEFRTTLLEGEISAADEAVKNDAIDADLRVRYPGQDAAIAEARASVDVVRRSVDWTGWAAGILAKLLNADELRALEALIEEPTYAVALWCVRRGTEAGEERQARGDPSSYQPSGAAIRLIRSLRCEAVTVEHAAAKDPHVDLHAVAVAFEAFFRPDMGQWLDQRLSIDEMGHLACTLEVPKVQDALDKQGGALFAAGQENAQLLFNAALARPARVLPNERCGALV